MQITLDSIDTLQDIFSGLADMYLADGKLTFSVEAKYKPFFKEQMFWLFKKHTFNSYDWESSFYTEYDTETDRIIYTPVTNDLMHIIGDREYKMREEMRLNHVRADVDLDK